jgi:hypothetical protein
LTILEHFSIRTKLRAQDIILVAGIGLLILIRCFPRLGQDHGFGLPVVRIIRACRHSTPAEYQLQRACSQTLPAAYRPRAVIDLPTRESFYPLGRARHRYSGSSRAEDFCGDSIVGCANRRSHAARLTGNGMRCARRGRGRFVQTTENPAGSPGAARGRVLLCKLIVKTCPQITVNWPISSSSILDDAATPFLISQRTREALSAKKARGALLGNRTNPKEARRLGRAAVRRRAEDFALAVAPIIAGIVASGIGTDAGIAVALNARGIAERGAVAFANREKCSAPGGAARG